MRQKYLNIPMYYSSAVFSGWVRLKNKSSKNFDIIVSKKKKICVVSFFNFAAGVVVVGGLSDCCPSPCGCANDEQYKGNEKYLSYSLNKTITNTSKHNFINSLSLAICFGFVSHFQANTQLWYELYIAKTLVALTRYRLTS